VQGRVIWPARFGEVLYVLDSSWNAPVGCAQVNALYSLGTVVPLYVDWNLWPASMVTSTATDGEVLFSRIAITEGSNRNLFDYERQGRPSIDAFGMVPSGQADRKASKRP
jgi:hypothetical protein